MNEEQIRMIIKTISEVIGKNFRQLKILTNIYQAYLHSMGIVHRDIKVYTEFDISN